MVRTENRRKLGNLPSTKILYATTKRNSIATPAPKAESLVEGTKFLMMAASTIIQLAQRRRPIAIYFGLGKRSTRKIARKLKAVATVTQPAANTSCFSTEYPKPAYSKGP